jgi:23S rRNA (adenine2503-C2)-methyltransferase
MFGPATQAPAAAWTQSDLGLRYNRLMLDYSTIMAALEDLGEPRYRADQVYRALTRDYAADFSSMTVLPARLRAALAERLAARQLEDVQTLTGQRGDAVKTLFAAADGAQVEAVLMRYAQRATVCVSSQVGCAVRCAFCASGKRGQRRNLSAEEMLDQVLHFSRLLQSEERRVSNVVFMGMGEPFHNYDETLRACRLLNDPEGFGLAARGISVSTVGVVPAIERFAREPLQLNLAVSLHAGTDALRNRLVPLNKTYPLKELMAACRRYVVRTRRKLFFEYVVLADVNDNSEQAAALAKLLARPLYHLNLIAFNETGGRFKRPSPERLADFRKTLEQAGVDVTVRRSPGADIEAACGQLVMRATHNSRPPAGSRAETSETPPGGGAPTPLAGASDPDGTPTA